jgi:hypothetical protein
MGSSDQMSQPLHSHYENAPLVESWFDPDCLSKYIILYSHSHPLAPDQQQIAKKKKNQQQQSEDSG